MASLRDLVVTLNANMKPLETSIEKGVQTIERQLGSVSRSVEGMNRSFQTTSRDISAALMTMNTGLAGLPYAITRATSAFALIGVAGAAAIYGISKALNIGIKTVDDYQVGIIGIAAALTNMAKPGQGSFADLFIRNKDEAQKMYRGMTLEATKHFATANEMMTVYNKLIQGGYATRTKEIGALGVIVDVIKLKTKGQDVERQLNTEIMAVMQGQAKAGSLMAQELQQRLGPGWADLVRKHIQIGDLVTWWASLYPGITAANQAIIATLNSQWATTKSLLEIIGIGGLQGIYQDIVDLVRNINDYLKTHEQTIVGGIKTGWIAIKDIVGGVYGVLSEVLGVMKELVVNAWKFVQFWTGISTSGPWYQMAQSLGKAGGPAGDFGFGALQPEPEQMVGPPMSLMRKLTYPKTPPAVQPPGTSASAKGANKIEAAQRQLENFENRMAQITSKAANESFGALEAWFAKEKTTLERIETVLGASYEARSALDAAYQAKRKRLIDKFSATEMKTFEKNAKEQEKLWIGSLRIYGEEFNAISRLSPKIEERNAMSRKALEIEIQVNRARFERNLLDLRHKGWISDAQEDELKKLKALEIQLRRNNQLRKELSEKGVYGGLKLGAENLREESKTWAARTTEEFVKTLPNRVSELMASSFIGILQGREQDFAQLGWNMGEAVIQKMLEGILMEIIPSLAEGVAGIFGGLFGGGGGGFLGGLFEGIAGLFFHGGGPVYAHAGWPRLRPGEVPIIAEEGERILSRSQNREYESKRSGAGITVNIHAPGADKSMDWAAIVRDKVVPEIKRQRARGNI